MSSSKASLFSPVKSCAFNPAALLLFLYVSAADARAQYMFDVWTIDDGLPQNSVMAILQTRDGYLMSCNKGIYRVSQQELNDFAEGRARSITSVVYGCQRRLSRARAVRTLAGAGRSHTVADTNRRNQPRQAVPGAGTGSLTPTWRKD
jgi:ligand-binding sensor domain-containing protein